MIIKYISFYHPLIKLLGLAVLMNLLYVTFKYLSMGNCRHFMTKTRFGIRDILDGRVFLGIYGVV